MNEHSRVKSLEGLNIPNEFIYKIVRKDDFADVFVHLSDAYQYSEVDFLSRPKQIKRGDFIVIQDWAGFNESLIERGRKNCVGIGPIRRLMGALNQPDVWKYESPEEREKRKTGTGQT